MHRSEKSGASCGPAHTCGSHTLCSEHMSIRLSTCGPRCCGSLKQEVILTAGTSLVFFTVWHTWVLFCEFRVSPRLMGASPTALVSWGKSSPPQPPWWGQEPGFRAPSHLRLPSAPAPQQRRGPLLELPVWASPGHTPPSIADLGPRPFSSSALC